MAVTHNTFWKAKFARLAQRIGDAKAIVAIARQMLVSVWYLWHNRTVDRHSDALTIAHKLWTWAEQGGKTMRHGLSCSHFVRFQLDQLGIGQELTELRYGSHVYRLPPAGFLVALDGSPERVAGFSIFGEKPGLAGATHTQLLSAVRADYRGRGVYGGLTRLLWQSLPRDATLLNVTHAENRGMQNAYHKSGRLRLADTVIVRRIFDIGEPVV